MPVKTLKIFLVFLCKLRCKHMTDQFSPALKRKSLLMVFREHEHLYDAKGTPSGEKRERDFNF